MGDSQVRRAMAVVFNAVEVVREAYTRRAVGVASGRAGASGGGAGGETWGGAGSHEGRGPGGAGEDGALVVVRNAGRRGSRRRAGSAEPGTGADAGMSALEAAGTVLWSVQGLLVSEGVERYRKRLRDAASELRRLGVSLRRADERDAAEALTDTADTLVAVAHIAQISVEAGLSG